MKKFASYLFVAILGGLVVVLSFHFLSKDNTSGTENNVNGLPVVQANYPVPHAPVIGPDFVDAADVTLHAVVHIKSELQQRNQVYNDFFD
ncbi:MAG: hypothetical protein K8S16_11520, partial [Bacteroidales bacterium]|nr:hypothetical protein [Bacteroidales bacterium]